MASAFLIDCSGSTRGWINDVERENLVLMCEAMQRSGDRYAVYAFTGHTRRDCRLLGEKTFEEPCGPAVKARIAGLKAGDYTRLGVYIRHITGILSKLQARTRVLVTLTDGRPDDYQGYAGHYGIEDIRVALAEARRQGMHGFCITVDAAARGYLPHMFGRSGFTLVQDPAELPGRLPAAYRRLTG